MVKTIVGVDGMMCGMCESHVNEVVRKSCERSGEKCIFNQESKLFSRKETDRDHL